MAAETVRKFRCKVEHTEEGMNFTYLCIPFDVKEVFGKARAPVKLTINDYMYRTTIAHMGGKYCVPLRREHRENAKVKAGDTVQVKVEADTDPRVVDVPGYLKKFLQKNRVWDAFNRTSYTHQKEHVSAVNEAKKEETRQARMEKMVGMLRKTAGR